MKKVLRSPSCPRAKVEHQGPSGSASRTPRYGGITIRCPRFNRDTEGGKTFLVTAAKLWNSLPINIRSSNSINASKQITIVIL